MFWYPIYIKFFEGNQKFLPYQHIIIKFVNKYKKLYPNDSIDNAIIYSKYYLNYILYQCTYDDNIMNIIINVNKS